MAFRKLPARGGRGPGPSWIALALLACAHASGDFVWVDSYQAPPQPVQRVYVIGPGDQLSVRVFNQDAMSARPRVRADGRISLPFLNDVSAAGQTTATLAEQIQARLKEFIVNPVVTVSLEEPKPFEVYVVGEVARAGRYPLDSNATVLQAIAAAGGLTDYAKRDRIFVVRQEPAPARIRFRFEALSRLEGKASTFRLKPGDTVVAE